MNDDTAPNGESTPDPGAATNPAGTPMPVELGSDPDTRRELAMFVAGPIVWFGHFALVYLVAEAGCTGDGPGLRLFEPPVPTVTTLVLTVLAAAGCLWIVRWHSRRWRRAQPSGHGQADGRTGNAADRPLTFAGMLLGWISMVSVLFVGVPALVFTGC